MSAPWRRVVRFIAQEDDKEYYGEPQLDLDQDIGLVYHERRQTLKVTLLSASPVNPSARLLPNETRTIKKLLSPLKRDEIVTIRGMAAQYHPSTENRVSKPQVASLFFKPISTLCGPEDQVLLPKYTRLEGTEDYEVEICVVVGKRGRDVPVEKAMEHVLGYCTVNDMTGREKLKKGGQAGFAKTYDTWTPFGPALIHPSQIKDPMNLEIRTTVNGKVWQQSNTRNMVLNIAELIHLCSQGTTLEPGSIIMTGSPLAPSDRPGPPYLNHGDEMRVWVEGCGTLINGIVDETRQSKAKL
ncbi:hypothetical protein ACM66B_002625 [Microbotryomycetes sp. NB124-2]